MEILVKFTPEEYERYQHISKNYDKVVEQRDEADYKFKALQDAIQEAGLGITISCGGSADKYSLHEMEKDLKEFWDKYPKEHYIKSYQE